MSGLTKKITNVRRSPYLNLVLSRQQTGLLFGAAAGVVLTLVGLFVATSDLPWYIVLGAVVLAGASVIVAHRYVSIAYLLGYLVVWLLWAPRSLSFAVLVAALGFAAWHGALTMAGSVPSLGQLATGTMRRWGGRLALTGAVVIVTFVVALILDDPSRAPSRDAVIVACVLALVVLVACLVAARRRTDSGVPSD
ncbi:hypothetical protein CLV47_102149 [Antricoccus suffuscus]|uniref:Uncharacterized protein n=1 Tax=Antricoccus suffuscus TaxID=1629062 RepID=A0A2T1A4D7_9ACTN|nr:hypothetical protein [Antricoccus suffuscus]PRZ43463.1 hypothetical protein CLV47_102149 [Antricoccus suffuscus]